MSGLQAWHFFVSMYNKTCMKNLTLEKIINRSIKHSNQMASRYHYILHSGTYTFSDVSIIPTILSKDISRENVNTLQEFTDIRANKINLFPAFGASMSFMRRRFADQMSKSGAAHILPRVNLTKQQRLEDTEVDTLDDKEIPGNVGAALGFSDIEDTNFIDRMLSNPSLKFLSIDVAHGASANMVKAMKQLFDDYQISNGLIVGNVGSVAGAAFLIRAAENIGLDSIILKIGVGPGASCTTRINTGVGVAQLSVLNAINTYLSDEAPDLDLKIIADGGVTTPGDFVKALKYSDGVMMGKYLTSVECENVEKTDAGYAMNYYGMASSDAKDNNRYIEGGSQQIKLNNNELHVSQKLQKLKDGLSSAMTYVDSTNLEEFRQKAEFSYNSYGAVIESGIH